ITNSVITGTTLQSANITVPTVTPNPPTPDSIYYSLSGNTLWVRGSISSTKDIAESYLLQGTPSNTFMTERRYLLNNTAYNSNSSYTSGTFLSNSTDDVTPIGTKNVGFLSANHGVNSPVVTSTGHDKTNADIDSVWQDSSGHQFLIASISGNAITFYSI
ncbi:MAG: hypothetical protein NTX85_02320, partial [Candidatus Nomurabacteria bacterium]|nr:hypothetical protein [Candidatus Nomurabacteria bacterium]